MPSRPLSRTDTIAIRTRAAELASDALMPLMRQPGGEEFLDCIPRPEDLWPLATFFEAFMLRGGEATRADFEAKQATTAEWPHAPGTYGGVEP